MNEEDDTFIAEFGWKQNLLVNVLVIVGLAGSIVFFVKGIESENMFLLISSMMNIMWIFLFWIIHNINNNLVVVLGGFSKLAGVVSGKLEEEHEEKKQKDNKSEE